MKDSGQDYDNPLGESKWPCKPLGEVCDVTRGTTITKKTARSGNVPVVAGGINPAYFHDTPNRPANVVTVSGSGANAGFVNFFDVPIWASDSSTVLPTNDNLDVQFVYRYLLAIQPFIYSELARGAAQPHVYPRDLAKLPIPIPPLVEQQRIVTILDEAFEGLDRARAHAEANLQNTQELFTASLRSLFSDNRENWPLRNIADVCVEFGRGKSRHRPRNDPRLYGGDMPFVQTGDLSRADHFLVDFTQTYSPEGVAQSRVWPKGTVCVAIVGATIGESAILEFDACFPDSVIGMVPDPSKADSEFLDFLLQFVKAELKEAGKGSARDNINLGTFSSRLFPIPDFNFQRAAIDQISRIDAHSRRLKTEYTEKLQDLGDLRQSLLQKAFAGELTR
ncbi:MAG: restriction endonuclease subunit S [Sedimentitalea sp.]|uniref:restriction endonuclease subunit S n=1 Tax=Sedimentitalea sp. TaxID=2048915 RepID=UPI003266D1C0